MSGHLQNFPFGAPVRRVAQLFDGSKKRVFVVGIYSSAVHARWIGPDNRMKIAALAVASEPYIFWRGDNAPHHIPTIDGRIGRLEAASRGHNGRSGRALDEFYLDPLGLSRDDAWLSDLVQQTLLNKGQRRAIENHYEPFVQRLALPECTVRTVPSNNGAWAALVDLHGLLDELEKSQADTIITLGNV